MDYKKLINVALDYRNRAYSPYSNFKVGAAVLFESGKIYGGCNVENASFGATNCAERTAIFRGISEGETTIKSIAIVGSLNEYTYPCGICRQVISEFGDESIEVILAKSEDDYIIKDMREVLPGAFKKEALGK
ncbi:cytidine deaminase [Clostridium saccharobutylicum]|uniref:Cytidine deaminase n=1 Tax=Clostridium saccharobutylicum DSM 13864 TaxID=1345695 RepID=U5MZ73_CLOSA|nr:cytidine deaminase [Clostridium saccharobutylicum]AGX44827.1 cytidine deaminase Cdd [Clostridium saccharobutylicum DSM 13864]AQR92111.1 cytidine deaminase [Clostridium saccharobutylicum]AQS02013.1 cytidine deaminase [Clostridium saccharobutylicum]AQS11616.1 cytidine deaminase [Clostridium saccharobutylicum]AQS15996.1 cytidine deaminase [Clostridium saccharobutylicum]